MSIQLKNEYLSLDIQKPGESYREARFDWTGQIIQITFLNKHTFCTTEILSDQTIDKMGRGLYNEFGLDQPIGYDECQIGGKFHKIGVGLLTRKSKREYSFFENYEITPYSFTYSVENSRAHFFCEAKKNQEYSFQLEKCIELCENSFTIHYSLSNYGKRIINTNEYVHNFLSINGRIIDENYKIFFPFPIKPEKFEQAINNKNILQINRDFISWNSTPDNQFFFSNINTDYKEKGKWKLINLNDNVGIQEETDFNIQKINLWGAAHVISPEIFSSVNVSPGSNHSWSRTYTLFTLD